MMELLAPAGGLETLKTAVLYGADAVYMGGTAYGLRAKARNFDRGEMQEAVAFAHAHGVKVHVTVNIIAHDRNLEGLEEYLKFLEQIHVDALIMADAGMIMTARQTVPDMEIHLSTQASATNYATFNFWHKMGVSRVVCARELSLDEIAEIRRKTDPSLEIEAFAHGAMCISISGRCLLSNYLAGRDSNQGLCAHPCRWQYRLVEETRPGEYFPITEGEEGTYIFNSKDLCMIEHLPQMEEAGINSIKIEGRMKSPLYVAMVTRVYREALDDLAQSRSLYESKKEYYKHLLGLVSHRSYTTGFYLGRPGPDEQVYDSADYIRHVDFAGVVRDTHKEEDKDSFHAGMCLIEQREKFVKGDTLYLLGQRGGLIPFTAARILNTEGCEVESAPHAQEKLYLTMPEQARQDMVFVKEL